MPSRPRPPVLRRLPLWIPADSCAAQHFVQTTHHLYVYMYLYEVTEHVHICLIFLHVFLPLHIPSDSQHNTQCTTPE